MLALLQLNCLQHAQPASAMPAHWEDIVATRQPSALELLPVSHLL